MERAWPLLTGIRAHLGEKRIHGYWWQDVASLGCVLVELGRAALVCKLRKVILIG